MMPLVIIPHVAITNKHISCTGKARTHAETGEAVKDVDRNNKKTFQGVQV